MTNETEALEKCNCRTNSDPETGEPEKLLNQSKYFPDAERKTVPVDACIANVIENLWRAGVRTIACCCGHNGTIPVGNGKPNVVLAGPEYAQAAYEVLANDRRDWWVIFWAGRQVSGQNNSPTQ